MKVDDNKVSCVGCKKSINSPDLMIDVGYAVGYGCIECIESFGFVFFKETFKPAKSTEHMCKRCKVVPAYKHFSTPFCVKCNYELSNWIEDNKNVEIIREYHENGLFEYYKIVVDLDGHRYCSDIALTRPNFAAYTDFVQTRLKETAKEQLIHIIDKCYCNGDSKLRYHAIDDKVKILLYLNEDDIIKLHKVAFSRAKVEYLHRFNEIIDMMEL